MSSYYMQQEIRSVSVKKVFGAEYSGVLRELVLSFMKMVGVAFVLGIPLGWYVMNRLRFLKKSRQERQSAQQGESA